MRPTVPGELTRPGGRATQAPGAGCRGSGWRGGTKQGAWGSEISPKQLATIAMPGRNVRAGLLALMLASGGSWGRATPGATPIFGRSDTILRLKRLRGGAVQTDDMERMLKKMDDDFQVHVKALENEDKEAAARINEIQQKFEKRVEELGLKGRVPDPGRRKKVYDVGVPVDEEVFEMLMEAPPISHTRRNYTEDDPFVHPDQDAEKQFFALLEQHDNSDSAPSAWIRPVHFPHVSKNKVWKQTCSHRTPFFSFKVQMHKSARTGRARGNVLKMNLWRKLDRQVMTGDAAAIFAAVFTQDLMRAAGQQGVQNVWGLAKPISANAEHLTSDLSMSVRLMEKGRVPPLLSVGQLWQHFRQCPIYQGDLFHALSGSNLRRVCPSLLCAPSQAAYSALHTAAISAPLGLLLFLVLHGNHMDPNALTEVECNDICRLSHLTFNQDVILVPLFLATWRYFLSARLNNEV
eukprot:760334-Hanusia_phi.AAC.9